MGHQIIEWTEEWINGLVGHPLRRAALATAADAVNERYRVHYRIHTDAELAAIAAASAELIKLCDGFWPVLEDIDGLSARDDPYGYVIDEVIKKLETAFKEA